MAVSIGQFIEQLAASGLMTAAEIEAFQAGLPPEKSPHDAQALARELILAGKLTKYQAQCVYQRKTKGLVLGEYVVLDKIGEGGMGQVLKARHRTMERIVALKILPPKSVDSPEAIKRFRREVRAAARLTHPNIVMAHDAGEHTGIHFLAMEYVEGKDLASVIKERGPLELAPALDYTLQTARGLAYAHAEGVIHRDIKPGNLLLDKKGTVKILDMGLARVALPAGTSEPGAERLTNSGQVMGTCDYMAPEQAYDTHRADERSDIYSLGCTLHRLLTGHPPYSRDTLMQILIAHREARVPSLRDARPDVHERVDEVFQKMVAKEPENRQQSMAEVIADLVGCLRLVARPAAAQSVSEESLSAAASDSLLRNLSFLQESVPPPLPRRHVSATSGEDTQVPTGHDQTGTSIATKIKQAMAATGQNPLALLAVAGASAVLVVVVALVLTLISREPALAPPRSPGDGRREPKRAASVATKGTQPDPLAKDKRPAPPPAIAPFDAVKAKECQKLWADYLGVPVEYTDSMGMKLVLIPPGEFEMGSTREEIDQSLEEGGRPPKMPDWFFDLVRGEAPRHRVRITRPFYLGKYEVTVREFGRFVSATGHRTDGEKDGTGGLGLDVATGSWVRGPQYTWQSVGFPQEDQHPVVNVSWNDAKAFCRWLGDQGKASYRLPTEAEWEYACRAGTAPRYSSGAAPESLRGFANVPDASLKAALKAAVPSLVAKSFRVFGAWDDGNPFTAAVGHYQPNGFGLHDMLGNVSEWCADWCDLDYYRNSPAEDPTGPPSGDSPVFRGGNWSEGLHLNLCACRARVSTRYCKSGCGFRVAMTLDADGAKAQEAGEFPGLPEFPETPAAATPVPAPASPNGWSEPVNLGPTVNTKGEEGQPALSGDGLILVFHSWRPDGHGGGDLWICTRATRDEPFSQPVNLGPTVNSGATEWQPGLSADALILLFASDRPGGQGGYDLWMCKRASREEPFGAAVNLGPTLNSTYADSTPALSPDGLTLLFGSDRPGGQERQDIWMSQRASPNGPFGPPVNLGPNVNSSADDNGAAISADGLTLYLTSTRPGGQGNCDLWRCTRPSLDQPFGEPVNLGATVNSSADDASPALSSDGSTLVFFSKRPGGYGDWDIWMCTRPPRPGIGGPSNGPRAAMKIELLGTLNSGAKDEDPWLSTDGLTIYWNSGGTIRCATRPDAGSPFQGPRELRPGRHPTLTPDGLEMLFLWRADSEPRERLWSARRPSVDASFGPPTAIRELESIDGTGRPIKGLCLSSDGLKLYFQATMAGAPALASTSRSTPGALWQTPQVLPVKLPDNTSGTLCWPFVTSDQRWLLCTGETGALLGRIMLYRRTSPESPLEGPVLLKEPGTGTGLFGRSPRYVEKTKELFFAAPDPIADQSAWSTANWDLWVLRGFDPVTAWQTGATSP